MIEILYVLSECKRLNILVMLTFAFMVAHGQADNFNDVQVPSSPEADAFVKYGNVDVLQYTGLPNISVPIATIKGREMNLPISLNYDAGGVKVQQIATSVGLGWNLVAGGAVTRNIIGRPDDYEYARPVYTPFYSNNNDPYNIDNNTIYENYKFTRDNDPEAANFDEGYIERYYRFLEKIGDGTYEASQDNYSFSIAGVSGTIVINYDDATAYCIEHPAYKIIPQFIPGTTNQITGWVINDDKGNKYVFQNIEKTYVIDNSELDTGRGYASAWYITSIETANDLDRFDFVYSASEDWHKPQYYGSNATFYDTPVNQEHCPTDQLKQSTSPNYQISQFELSAILFNSNQTIEFTYGAERLDLTGRKELNSIKVYNYEGSIINTIELDQSYFGNVASGDERRLRLKLEGVNLFGSDPASVPMRYRFDYFPGSLPSRDSFSQDYWGYYNGKSNTTLIPYNHRLDVDNQTFQGANREPDVDAGIVGTMSRITYPTGGYTDFQYESHKSTSTAWTRKSLEASSDILLPGGEDAADTFQFGTCDDRFGSNLKPKGIRTSFIVPEDGQYIIQVSTTGTVQYDQQFQFVGIYRAGSVDDCQVIDGQMICSITNEVSAEACDFIQGGNPDLDPAYFLYNNLNQDSYSSIDLALEKGSYEIIALNTNDLVNLRVEVLHIAELNSNTVGGLRLKKQSSFASSSSTPIITKYEYGENGNGKGTLHALAKHESSLSSTSTISLGEYSFIDVLCKQVIRSSNSSYSSNRHVTYEFVKEIKGDNDTNGYTAYQFDDTKEATKNGYIKLNVNNGKLLDQSFYNQEDDVIQSSISTYYQESYGDGTVGLVTKSPESVDNTVDKYVVSEKYENPQNREQVYNKSRPNSQSPCAWNGNLTIVYTCVDFFNYIYNIEPNPIKDAVNNLISEGVPAADIHVSSACDSPLPNALITYPFFEVKYCIKTDYEKDKYLYPRYWSQITGSRSIQFSDNEQMEVETNYQYGNSDHYQVTNEQVIDSRDQIITTNYYYPHDRIVPGQSSVMDLMIQQNRLGQLVEKEVLKDGVPLSRSKTSFQELNPGSGVIMPILFESARGTNEYEVDAEILKYSSGNPVEVLKRDGVKVSYLWGYNNRLVIAKITNSSHESAINWLANNEYSNWQDLSGSDLKQAMTALRSGLSDAMITTFIYKVGIGIESITDSNGITTSYNYDEFNRLKLVKDNDEKILQKNEYNYSNSGN